MNEQWTPEQIKALIAEAREPFSQQAMKYVKLLSDRQQQHELKVAAKFYGGRRRREHEGLMSAPTVDEFAEAVRELLEYADGMSLKTGVRFDKLLLRHELGKPEPDQAAVKRLTEEIAFAENYGKQD